MSPGPSPQLRPRRSAGARSPAPRRFAQPPPVSPTSDSMFKDAVAPPAARPAALVPAETPAGEEEVGQPMGGRRAAVAQRTSQEQPTKPLAHSAAYLPECSGGDPAAHRSPAQALAAVHSPDTPQTVSRERTFKAPSRGQTKSTDEAVSRVHDVLDVLQVVTHACFHSRPP